MLRQKTALFCTPFPLRRGKGAGGKSSFLRGLRVDARKTQPWTVFHVALGCQRHLPHSRMWMMAAYIYQFIIHQSPALRCTF
jgi:RecA-family ATPase